MSHRFVVTGGNGFIGSHMCAFLHGLGHEVLIIDDLSTSPSKATHSFGEFSFLKLSDPKIKDVLREVKPAAVFHFAARALVGEGEKQPLEYYQNNISESLALLSAMEETQVQLLIFSSTCATFGNPKSERIQESTPQYPINTYGRSKLMLETILRDLVGKKRISAGVLRYFNVAGCDPHGLLGENHDPEEHLIPNLCLGLLKGSQFPFTIHGDQFETPDGTAIRDYIHVLDLVRAHWLCYEFLQKNELGFYDFNLGCEKGYSVQEVLTCFEKITQSKLEVKIGPARAGDPPCLVSDTTKAKRELKFNPQYSLEDCISHTYAYFKANFS